jgi:hypothetical protein
MAQEQEQKALKASEVLERAADLIEPAGAWIQGNWARDAMQRVPETIDGTATCWCLYGATRQTARNSRWEDLTRFIRPIVGGEPISWNDEPGRTQAEVVAALRKAAELARSEGC